jgi:glycosyltransferase involved in cell wall biosynthesis
MNSMKNVLFITYFWPPSGKASVHWPLFVIKHLPNFGWQPFVLTADADTFSHPDTSLLSEIDPNLTVVKTAANEPFQLYRKFLGKEKDSPLIASESISLENKDWRHRCAVWIRMNLFVPDARVGWNFSAHAGAEKILREHAIDAIVSIGPPHSSHLIGKKLSRRNGIPHIPVLIDPWVDIVYYKNFKRNPLTRALDNYFERKTFSHASTVIFVTKSSAEEYQKKYPWLQGKSSVLYWGYNEEYFTGKSKKESGGTETILHAGNIFSFQNPHSFWINIKKEIERGRKLRLRFIGTVDPDIKRSVAAAGLDPVTEYKGFLPYNEVVQEMIDASYLLVCATEKRHVPGKLFEYLRTGNKIIAFGDDNTEVQRIIEDVSAGKLFHYQYDKGDIFDQLNSINPRPERALQYSREEISRALSRILP